MIAVNRSCSSETAVNFRPIDETLDLRCPPPAVPYFVSSAPKCRPDTAHESPLGFLETWDAPDIIVEPSRAQYSAKGQRSTESQDAVTSHEGAVIVSV